MKGVDIMFWFERKAEEIEDPKKFIEDVLREFTTSLAGEGGIQLGRYVAEIKSPETQSTFLDAINVMLLSNETEDWMKEELAVTKEVVEVREKELATYRKVTVKAERDRLRI